MSGDDDERQASAGARQAGRVARGACSATADPAPARPGGDQEFDLFYVRTGRKSAHPLVIIPGGPGAASIALYRGFRRRAAAEGLDVIMVEHRGVGMSRHDDSGADLPPEALTIDQVVDDVAAVLDDAQVDKAVIYGTSYGTYVAAGVGVRHPDRVHGMILDSPVLSAHDIDAVRDATRRLLWDGDTPETADLAPKVRRLVDQDLLSPEATSAGRGDVRLRRARSAAASTRPFARRPPGAVVGVGASAPDSCSNARRRIVTSPTWWAGSGTAN